MDSKGQLVHSQGIYHGLPIYSNDAKHSNLTAIVTGANGISGYHMVKVLAAAPQRWKKIYCLSRRPPPDYFFAELGEGASRVEHVSSDFLASPEEIGKSLKSKVGHVDYVFFFSFVTPPQSGKVLGMWSNADELADVNASILRNFIGGLQAANLKPKRFLLQTGAKHYGFQDSPTAPEGCSENTKQTELEIAGLSPVLHCANAFHLKRIHPLIGPATSPSFESDPRITLENNFYYPQEDLLDAYCKEAGLQWNVMRPSYIIGAVRDNLLNNMVGIAIYASVCAHLKEPLAFPGDYAGWDREHCQSTAMLNSYFYEWTVFNPDAGNEAFNVQDGLPFTWGRFWQYLAGWYGLQWTPPEADESKYRVVESRHAATPRGYGPHAATRSTFSLVEWSSESKVKQAWDEMTKQYDLKYDPFADRASTFGVTDSAIIGGWALSLSIRKARKMGWTGSVDSYESAFYTLQDLARLKVAAPMKMTEFIE